MGLSDRAVDAAHQMVVLGDAPRDAVDEALAAAYPIIRSDVIAEVLAVLKAEANRTMEYDGLGLAADVIVRNFGESTPRA